MFTATHITQICIEAKLTTLSVLYLVEVCTPLALLRRHNVKGCGKAMAMRHSSSQLYSCFILIKIAPTRPFSNLTPLSDQLDVVSA